MCVISLGKGQCMSRELYAILDKVDIGSIHQFILPPETPAELHYHDFDEYWLFIEGTTTVTLRLADGTKSQYDVVPGDLVATPKGVEHGHTPRTVTKYIQFTGKIRPGAKPGHLKRRGL